MSVRGFTTAHTEYTLLDKTDGLARREPSRFDKSKLVPRFERLLHTVIQCDRLASRRRLCLGGYVRR